MQQAPISYKPSQIFSKSFAYNPTLDDFELEQRKELVKDSMQLNCKSFIEGHRKILDPLFYERLYNMGILQDIECKFAVVMYEAENVTEEELKVMKQFEDQVCTRVTAELLRIFPEFKPRI
jgi:hypothetical protein